MLIKLKAKRVEKGYTQEELAKLINLGVSNYNLKENEKVNFTYAEIVKILQILDCKFEDIFLQ